MFVKTLTDLKFALDREDKSKEWTRVNEYWIRRKLANLFVEAQNELHIEFPSPTTEVVKTDG